MLTGAVFTFGAGFAWFPGFACRCAERDPCETDPTMRSTTSYPVNSPVLQYIQSGAVLMIVDREDQSTSGSSGQSAHKTVTTAFYKTLHHTEASFVGVTGTRVPATVISPSIVQAHPTLSLAPDIKYNS
jgi:hypothetical protein